MYITVTISSNGDELLAETLSFAMPATMSSSETFDIGRDNARAHIAQAQRGPFRHHGPPPLCRQFPVFRKQRDPALIVRSPVEERRHTFGQRIGRNQISERAGAWLAVQQRAVKVPDRCPAGGRHFAVPELVGHTNQHIARKQLQIRSTRRISVPTAITRVHLPRIPRETIPCCATGYHPGGA